MKQIVVNLSTALGDIWSELVDSLLVNLLWTFMVLLVIPGPPATLALFYYANRRASGEVTTVSDFWTHIGPSWGSGWRWALAAGAVGALLYGDYLLTARYTSISGALVQGFYLALLAAWGMVQLYTLPFLFEQQRPSTWQALRNGAVMLGRHPLFSLALGLMLFAVLLLGTALFMITFVIGAVFTALVASYTVKQKLI